MTRERTHRHSPTPAARSGTAATRRGIAQLALPIAGVMLLLWLTGTLLEGPGWIHGLLTGGIFLLIYGIVARGTPRPPSS